METTTLNLRNGMLYASGFAVSDREFITSDMQLFYEGVYYAIGGKTHELSTGERPKRRTLLY